MGKYDDIIGLPHHQSAKRPHMSVYDRAAQFAPFAALTGYGDVIAETERLTEGMAVLDEDALAELDFALSELAVRAEERRKIKVTYFVPDGKKSGGAYAEYCGVLRRADGANRRLLFEDGTVIPLARIVRLEGAD